MTLQEAKLDLVFPPVFLFDSRSAQTTPQITNAFVFHSQNVGLRLYTDQLPGQPLSQTIGRK